MSPSVFQRFAAKKLHLGMRGMRGMGAKSIIGSPFTNLDPADTKPQIIRERFLPRLRRHHPSASLAL